MLPLPPPMLSDRLEGLYLALPPRLRRLIPEHWRLGLRDRLLPEWRPGGPGSVRRIEDRLWGGFSERAEAELALLIAAADPRRPKARAEAGWARARWQAARGETAAALESLRSARAAHPGGASAKRYYLMEAKLLCLLGRGAEARALLPARGFDASVLLMRAASHAPTADPEAPDPEAALAALNRVFHRFRLGGVARRDAGHPLSIDNLAPVHPPKPARGPLVSVILPAFRAETVLGTTLESLAAQSWRDMEVLVVDDASPDGTAAVAAEFAARDPRFRLIRSEVNGGAYAARNRALAEARGEFVTVHDADDWSHPEKIQAQAEHLLRNPAEPQDFTAWARTLPDLTIIGTVRGSRSLVSPNLSSQMIRRAALLAAGGWDDTRAGGDSELIARIEALGGRPREAWRARILKPACPFAFGRVAPGQLTGAELTHVSSLHHGLRRDYHEAAALWHEALRRGEGRAALARTGAARFPAPAVLRAARVPEAELDFLVIADFNMRGGAAKSALEMIEAGARAGRAAGLLHYRRADLDVTRPLDPAVRARAAEAGWRVVSPGESLAAKTVILSSPPLLNDRMDRFPVIAHERLAVVVNQMAERDTGGHDRAYDVARVRGNLRALLGSEGVWIPISGRVRALMAADPRYPRPGPETWTPLIDTGAWAARAPVWRGDVRARPVLGRHGRDHPLKWPRAKEALAAAYCAGKPCETRFLGGAAEARRRLGRWPANWHVLPYGAEDARAFLGGLDFFLHYPDPDYIEEFGRAALEAMALGVPVILPPEFEPTFGQAALYAGPEEVWPLVERLWRDEATWSARAEAGRAFARGDCDAGLFPGRLDTLAALAPLGDPTALPAAIPAAG